MKNNRPSVLVIYTGGTIGMITDEDSQTLAPVNFYEIQHVLPEINRFGYNIRTITFDCPLDSSDIGPTQWIELVKIIENHYADFDGFVILHGTDTMAFTASALSFMCENLHKPIIITGSQLPLGKLRTDGKEHLLTSIEIAALKTDGLAMVPEVCIYFNGKLLRGNRCRKISSEWFNAFRSGNFPALAEVGVSININSNLILKPDYNEPTTFYKTIDSCVGILKIHPGMCPSIAYKMFHEEGIKAIVIESYGSGNVPSDKALMDAIFSAIEKDKIIFNVSQCIVGGVNMNRYKTSLCLQETGVCCGKDITTEAALTKLMFLLGQGYPTHLIKQYLTQPMRGELSAF